jgi:hypothetical protein
MAVRRHGSGPDLVLFHGGMGSWRHWTRNIDALAARFTVHVLDHPSYGDSATVPRETTGPAYLDLVHRLFVEMFPGEKPLRRLLVRRRDRNEPCPAARPARHASLPGLTRRLSVSPVRRAADPKLQGGRQRRAALP